MKRLGNSIFVVGIDIGSEYSGYAFASREDIQQNPPRIRVREWNESNQYSLKCPTAILFNLNEEMVAFGFEAERMFSELLEDDEHHDYYYFRNFRNDLYQNEAENKIITDVGGKPLKALTVISQIIGYFRDDSIKRIHDRMPWSLYQDDLFFVVTLPAMWSDQGMRFMKKAAMMAGIKESRLAIVFEPDAASLYVLRTSSDLNHLDKRILMGEKYMVINLEGSAEISCHRNNLLGSKGEEIVPLNGGIPAGKSIGEAFYTFLCEIFGIHIMESFKSEEYEDYINLFRELERKKQTIRSDAESKVVINLPVSLLDLVKQTHKRVTEVIEQSPYKEAVTNSKQKMYISPNTFRDLCKPTIRAVIKHIKTIHKDQTANDINILMIVGELSEGKMVQDAMHKYFGESKTVIIPNEAGMAILKGAVLFAFQPMNKGTHTAKYTYGVKCWSDWNPELYPASKEVIINDKSKCKDIFYTLLSKEDTFTAGFTVSTIISVATNSRNTFDCLIFISSNLKPRFTTDPSCKQLSHIKVLLPAQYKDNEIEVMLTFWDDEILVRTKELKSGKMYEQYIEYQDISNEDTSDEKVPYESSFILTQTFVPRTPNGFDVLVMLLDELRGLGLEYVSDLNELLTDSSQKSFWNRIYLVGPYNVGKTCLAKLLVGEAVTKTRQSTDGIWIYMGRAGMDVDKMEWVFFPKGNAIKEVVTNMLMSMTFADTQQSFTKESISLTEKVPTPQHLSSTHGDNKVVSIDVHHDKTNTNQGISTETNYLGNVSRSQNEEIVHSKTLPSKEMNNQHDELKENAADVEYEMEVSSSDDTKIELFSDNVMSEEKDQSDDSDNQSSESDYPMFQYDSNDSTAESLCENEEQNVASNRSIKFKPNEINIPSNDQLSDITVLSSGSDTSLEYQVNESKTPEMQTDGQVVTDNSQCEWLEEIITDMSHDKIHQLLVKAVQEGKYKQKIVPIDIWDFGGQKDYYMTHQLFITSRGIFVLMFDGSIDLHKNMPDLCFLPGHFGKPTVAVYLLHWVNSILTYCSRTKDGFPKIIFVATHKDTKWFDWTKEARRRTLENGLQNLFKTHTGIDHLEFKPLIFVDATNPRDQEIAQLRTILMQRAIEHPRWGEPMPTKWIPLELQLAQKSEEGMNIISREQLKQLNSRNGEMVLSEKQLETFLKVHHSLGKLLYFDVKNLRDYIIISPAYLVEVLRSIVTERQFWSKEKMYSTIFEELQNNGRIERDAIFRLWEQERFNHILPYKEYMLQILVHLDVIIAPRSSFEDVTGSVQDVPSFLVPCMIKKGNDTNFLGRFWKSNNSIILAYRFNEQVIPPALAYRFINSFVSGWKIKMYKEGNKTSQMLFSDLAVIELDTCHDVAVQVRENRVIVSLIHAKTKDDIIPTLASSLQECLTVAIERISEFYSTLSEDANSQGRNHVMPFNIEFGVFCKSDLCFLNHKDMQSSIWICKKHRQRHPVKYLSVWFSEKINQGPFNICVSSCAGLGKLEKEQSPLPQHIRRIASQISPEKCHDIALELGLSESEWNDLDYQFQHQPPNDLKFMALWSCMLKRRHITFDILKDALKNSELSEHLLCQVFRDVIPDIPEKSKDSLNKIPSFNLLHELCNHIGTRIMQIAIELDLDIPAIQRIQQEHDKKPLEQTKEMFRRWRQKTSPKPTVLGLLKALDRIGIFGTTCSVVLQFSQE